MKHLRPLLCAAAAAASLPASAQEFPSLTIQSVFYESACVPSNWASIAAEINRAAIGKNPANLVRLTRVMLCESGANADEFLRRNAVPKIPVVAEETGSVGKSKSTIDRMSLSAYGGEAWSASIEAKGEKVSVSYYPNEACITSRDFSFRQGRWLLVSIADACD